jgi:thiamine biosynthesis lipoprotein
MHYHEFRAMNSAIVLAASNGDPAGAEAGFRLAHQIIENNERRFSRFLETSELAQLNLSAGSWFPASNELFRVIQIAQRLALDTHGLFNPAILPALKQAGYDRSMDEIKNAPPRIAKHLPVADIPHFGEVQLDPATKSVLLPQGMQIDLGGIAKGWIAEQAARRLADFSGTCGVSAGGDMFLIGLPDGETTWEVGLENPLDPEQDLAILHVLPGAIATSSIAKRQWQQGGQLQHHLIDPRTGKPADTEWLSVTVWAEQAAEAEVYAKVLLIAGAQDADGLFKNQSSKAYLAVDKHGQLYGSKNYHEVFHV